MNNKELIEYTKDLSLLYVEDDDLVRTNMSILLKNFFPNILTAKNGEEGLSLYMMKKADIIFTDIQMPRMNGIEMSKAIRAIEPSQTIVFLTAFDTIDFLLESIELGVDGYILKPFTAKQITTVLSKVVVNIISAKEHDNYKSKLEEDVKKRTSELESSKVKLQIQKDELEAIFSTSKDGIAIVDLDTNFLKFNEAYLKMTGFTTEELLTKSCIGLSEEEDARRSKELIKTTIKEGSCENFEKTCYVKDGRKLVVNMSMALMPNKKEFVVSTRDITEARIAKKKLQNYMDLIDENIVTSSTDLNGIITHVSKAFCEVCGYKEEELIGKNHRIIRAPENKASIYKKMWDTITSGETWSGEIKNVGKKGNIFWMHSSVFPIFNDENEKIGYTSIRHNITDKKHVEELSITDALTSIFNRRHFNSVFPKFIKSAKRKNDLLCFLMLDIDYFKLYNDNYGHQKGDDVLIEVAKCMKENLRRVDDYLFRLGGEEFGIIFKTESRKDAIEFSDNIRKNIEKINILHEYNEEIGHITVSLGLACEHAANVESEDSMYKKADELLYKAKNSGRNKLCSE
ncbi:MAG: diguanylate cyclase [Helicobacteraceae bacterium]|nr:diguanylate cyclase [Helicobacteraceae bacterium]